jgi:hypothetical protein
MENKTNGLPLEFRLTSKNGQVLLLDLAGLIKMAPNLGAFQVSQFTGIVDRLGEKIYFGDTLIFADKVEWYKGEFWSKVALGDMTKAQALAEINKLPYEKRTVSIHSFEWLTDEEVQKYWEVL